MSEERWSQQKEWAAEPHDVECNCRSCHQDHIDNDEVEDNARRFDFECCKYQIEDWEQKGLWCKYHGSAYMENGKCNECLDALELWQNDMISRGYGC